MLVLVVECMIVLLDKTIMQCPSGCRRDSSLAEMGATFVGMHLAVGILYRVLVKLQPSKQVEEPTKGR